MKPWEKTIIFGVFANLVFIGSLYLSLVVLNDWENTNIVNDECEVLRCYVSDYTKSEPPSDDVVLEDKFFFIMLDIRLDIQGKSYMTTDHKGLDKGYKAFEKCEEYHEGGTIPCYYNKRAIENTLGLYRSRAEVFHPMIGTLAIVSFIFFWILFAAFFWCGLAELCKRR